MSFISPNKLHAYFTDNFNPKKTSQNWFAFKCPMCNELETRKKIAVNYHYAMVKCWICGYKETAIDFVADYEGIDYKQARDLLNNYTASLVELDLEDNSTLEFSAIDLPEGYRSILEGSSAMAKRARKYLEGRGFDLLELDRMGLGYVDTDNPFLKEDENYFGYIIVLFKKRGKLVYYIGRDFIGQFLRYKNPSKETFGIGKADLIFNEDAFSIYDTVFMFEGWSDAVTIGKDATATQGWSLSTTQKSIILRSQVSHIVMAPDKGVDNMGISFYDKAAKLAMELMAHKDVTIVNMQDLEDGKDVNAIGRIKFMEMYKNTPKLTMTEAYKILLG